MCVYFTRVQPINRHFQLETRDLLCKCRQWIEMMGIVKSRAGMRMKGFCMIGAIHSPHINFIQWGRALHIFTNHNRF